MPSTPPIPTNSSAAATDPTCQSIVDRLQRLVWTRDERTRNLHRIDQQINDLEEYLKISDDVTEALDLLSRELFQDTLHVLQQKLTIALQEVLEQPLEFQAHPAFKHNSAVVEFSVTNSGHQEDVLRGQGGSVQNVLSVGLRLFALAQLDPHRHRRFLVLDEQDCWLRPELVPRLVKIIHQAAGELGYQVLLISHHDISLFEDYADKIYRMIPDPDGVQMEIVKSGPCRPDEN